MVSLAALWLPILLSAIAVFLLSFVIHTLLRYHRNDVQGLQQERKIADALRPFAIPPGDYVMPHAADAKEMRTPEFIQKTKAGPVMILTVWPNRPMNMGSSLAMWFGYSIVVGALAAYVAGSVLAMGAEYVAVFRVIAAVAFAGYALAIAQASIWWGRNWGFTLRTMFDGLVYAVVTAGIFGWLWP